MTVKTTNDSENANVATVIVEFALQYLKKPPATEKAFWVTGVPQDVKCL